MMQLPADLVSAVERAATLWPDKVAWRFDLAGAHGLDDTATTFAEIDVLSARLAGALHTEGVRPGDVVGVLLHNQPELPLAWLALARLGAAMVPINVRYQRADTQHVLELAQATRVITSAEFGPLLSTLDPAPQVLLISALVDAGSPPAPARTVDAGAVVNIQMTSGTTGRPKGCVLTHDYWITLGTSMVQEFPMLTDQDVMLTAQPFSYVDPQWNVVSALLAGAELVVLDGFHPSTFWSKVRRHAVTYFYCLAAMPTLLLRMPPDDSDQHHVVRAVQCSAIPPALHRQIEERWGAPWYEAFGMTETGADLRVDRSDHDRLVGSGSVGRAARHREARISPDGELLLRGPGMMRGYYRDAAATASAFDDDGWFHTGDLARMDEDGNVFLVGRLKDMIRRSGENIAAREVEEVLLSHPLVSLAAVIAVPDDLRGEEVKAYVVVDDSIGPDAAAQLSAYCAGRLAGFKVPRFWSFHADLPRTPSERVEKAKLVELDGLTVEAAQVGR